MWYLWMDLGTGNANFFYAITLLWAAWQVTASFFICMLMLVSVVLQFVAIGKTSCNTSKEAPFGHSCLC